MTVELRQRIRQGEKLRTLRMQRQLSAEALAVRIDDAVISRNTIYSLENGRGTFDSIIISKLSQALDVPESSFYESHLDDEELLQRSAFFQGQVIAQAEILAREAQKIIHFLSALSLELRLEVERTENVSYYEELLDRIVIIFQNVVEISSWQAGAPTWEISSLERELATSLEVVLFVRRQMSQCSVTSKKGKVDVDAVFDSTRSHLDACIRLIKTSLDSAQLSLRSLSCFRWAGTMPLNFESRQEPPLLQSLHEDLGQMINEISLMATEVESLKIAIDCDLAIGEFAWRTCELSRRAFLKIVLYGQNSTDLHKRLLFSLRNISDVLDKFLSTRSPSVDLISNKLLIARNHIRIRACTLEELLEKFVAVQPSSQHTPNV